MTRTGSTLASTMRPGPTGLSITDTSTRSPFRIAAHLRETHLSYMLTLLRAVNSHILSGLAATSPPRSKGRSMDVSVSALTKIPWFNPRAVDGRRINLMPYWDGQKWNVYHLHGELVISLQIVDVDSSDYLATAPQRPTDMRIPFAEIMWQRASFPDTVRFIRGILDDFANFSISVHKLKFLHAKRNEIPNLIVCNYAKTEIEYILSLARGVFDLLQELFSVLWKEHVQLHDPVREKARKRAKMPPSFARVVLKGEKIISAEELSKKWGLPESLAAEYTQVAPFFLNLRDWRDRIIHGGTDVGLVFVDDTGFLIRAEDKLFSWADCWSPDQITETGLAPLDPWLTQIIFGSMGICSAFAYRFAQAIALLEPIAPGLMVFSRNPTDGALHELKQIWDRALKARDEREAAERASAKRPN